MAVRVAALALLLADVLTAPARPVWACSCIGAPAPNDALNDAHAVFSGSVTGIVNRNGFNLLELMRRLSGQLSPATGGDSRRVTLLVADSWKGVTQSPVTVATGSGSADCGYNFAVGRQYLVYAYDNGGVLGTNICLRTAEITLASADLAYLRAQPALPVTAAPSTLPGLCVAGAAGALAVLLLAGGVVWALRRRAASPR
jgi:hypothetical protein